MPHQMLKVKSAVSFVSDTWEALLDKMATNFKDFPAPTAIFKDF